MIGISRVGALDTGIFTVSDFIIFDLSGGEIIGVGAGSILLILHLKLRGDLHTVDLVADALMLVVRLLILTLYEGLRLFFVTVELNMLKYD